jgi:flavin reductase (DIM6/NTAB) family NADH-FMN oxidoreductase RutF
MESAARRAALPDPADAAQPPDAVGQRRFRDAMALFPTGVTLLTTRGPDGQDRAITANSFTSVSLDPLLVLISVEHASRLHDAVLATGLWGVSLLGDDAEALSRRFARRGHRVVEGLAGVPHHRGRHSGALLLDGALATFECRTRTVLPGGDHTVLIGAVLGIEIANPDAPPLLWHRGRYQRIVEGGRPPGRAPG